MRLLSLLALLCLGSIAAPAALAQDVIDCDSFWRNKMPLIGRSTDTMPCREYVPGAGTSALLTGDEYRIFLAEVLNPEDPDIRTRLGWLAEGIDETVGAFHRLGGAVRFYVYVSENPYGVPSDYSKTVYASRSGRYDYDEPCPIFFYPYAMTRDYDDFKQALAHEAFHCIQSSRYWDQLIAGGNAAYTDWWVEGTAEYFGNTVYPDVNREWPRSGVYDPDTSLLAQAYQVNFFFQDFANQAGNEAILRLMASLPTVAGADQQQSALARFPGMQETLHGFGQRYLDQRVHDTGLLFVAVEPEKGDAVTIDGPATLSYGVPAFTLQRKQLQFAAGQVYRISVDETGGGRVSAQDVAAGATWDRLPDELTTECESTRSYEFLATSAVAAGAREYDVTINVSAEPRTDCEKKMLACTDLAEHDSCVVGTWIVDQAFATEQLRALLGGRVEVKPVSGEERVTYSANGSASGTAGTTFQGTAHLNSGDTPITVETDSQETAAWSTAGGSLHTCRVSGNSAVRKEVDFPSGRESGSVRLGTGGGVVFPYVCNAGTLELTLPGGRMKKRYNRVPE